MLCEKDDPNKKRSPQINTIFLQILHDTFILTIYIHHCHTLTTLLVLCASVAMWSQGVAFHLQSVDSCQRITIPAETMTWSSYSHHPSSHQSSLWPPTTTPPVDILQLLRITFGVTCVMRNPVNNQKHVQNCEIVPRGNGRAQHCPRIVR